MTWLQTALLSCLVSLLAPAWSWTLRWWEKPTVWSQTCWQTPHCPLIPAAHWRLSETCSAPRSACSHCIDLASPQTCTPALTRRTDLNEPSVWPSQRYTRQIILAFCSCCLQPFNKYNYIQPYRWKYGCLFIGNSYCIHFLNIIRFT